MIQETLWAAGLSLSTGAAGVLPNRVRDRFAAGLGAAVSHLFGSKRRAVQNNLRRINAHAKTNFCVDDVFRNFGLTLSDFLSGRPVSWRVEGRERAETARALGRGALVLTTHLGNWELGGRVLSDWGWPVTAVYQPYRSRAMEKFIQSRRSPALDYLAVGRGAAIGIAKVLKRRGIVAMLGDRPYGEDGGRVSVCGSTMQFPRGPFLLAARSSVPVIPGFALMEKPGRYRVVVEEPLWAQGADPVQNLMDKMAQVLGKYIATHGDQWYCFEPAWDA